jgi:hypothetical protein
MKSAAAGVHYPLYTGAKRPRRALSSGARQRLTLHLPIHAIQRFLSEDPKGIGGGYINLFTHVAN